MPYTIFRLRPDNRYDYQVTVFMLQRQMVYAATIETDRFVVYHRPWEQKDFVDWNKSETVKRFQRKTLVVTDLLIRTLVEEDLLVAHSWRRNGAAFKKALAAIDPPIPSIQEAWRMHHKKK